MTDKWKYNLRENVRYTSRTRESAKLVFERSRDSILLRFVRCLTLG